MQRIQQILFFSLFTIGCYTHTDAQQASFQKPQHIEPYNLVISDTKTSNVIFPFAVKSVDRGSADLLVQKAKGADNILQLKAAKDRLAETNLSVVTNDGKFYSFLVNYDPSPKVLNISFLKDSLSAVSFPTSMLNESELQKDCMYVVGQKGFMHESDHAGHVKMSLTGIYINEDMMYFKIEITNTSAINYNIDGVRFSVNDRIKNKRYATQEVERSPVYVFQNKISVKAGNKETIVYAVPMFTIPDKKIFSITMSEKNGGRHLHLKINNNKLFKLRMIYRE